MPPAHEFECRGCGAFQQLPRSAARIRYACQECGSVTTWERGDPVAQGGAA